MVSLPAKNLGAAAFNKNNKQNFAA